MFGNELCMQMDSTIEWIQNRNEDRRKKINHRSERNSEMIKRNSIERRMELESYERHSAVSCISAWNCIHLTFYPGLEFNLLKNVQFVRYAMIHDRKRSFTFFNG